MARLKWSDKLRSAKTVSWTDGNRDNSLVNKSSRRYRVPIRYSLSNQKHPESPMLPDVTIQSMGGLDFRQKGVFKMPPDSASATPLRDTVGMTPWGDLR